jgi:potassium efflux system protein
VNMKVYTIVPSLSLLRKGAMLGIALLVAIIQLSGNVLADQQPSDIKTAAAHQEKALMEPNLSQIIPLTTDLSARLAALESKMTDILNLAPIIKEFSVIAARVEEASTQLQTLKSSNKGTYVRYIGIKQELANEKLLLNKASKPVAAAIQQLDMWDHEWLVEHKNWQTWQSTLLKERSPDQLRVAFEKAELTINKALSTVLRQLVPLMVVQARGAEVITRLDLLNNQLGMLIAETRMDSLFGKSPPMYSPLYFSQFRIELWQGTWGRLSSIGWSDNSFFARYGFFYGLLSLLFIGTSVVLRRNRQTLMESKFWFFLAERPLSTPLFICALIAAVQLKLSDGPAFANLLNTLVGGIACVRLVNHVLKQPWQKQAVYGVMTAYVVSLILLYSDVPTPIFRLYLFAVSLAGLIFCLRWQKESVKQGEPRLYSRVLGLNALLCIIIIIADFFGQAGVANYLFKSSLMTLVILLPFMLFIYMIRGGLHWVFFSSPVWNIKSLRNDAAEYVRKSSLLIEAAIVVFIVLPAILAAWGLFESVPLAISGLLSPGFTMGGQYISVGLLAAAIVTLYGSFFASKLLPQVLLDEHISGRVMQRGAQLSIGHLLKYVIIFIGFMLALSFVGIDLTKLTIIMSAFGIGIGFGLQGIVNNFVSGLILLFERPLREGDTIEIGTDRAVIKKIGLRATNVQTPDNANVIIPNADLISNQVTNWTLNTREVRYSVPVGVAYGTDVNLVNETLLACANDNTEVLKSPAPQALFLKLGDSSLDFELRVWIQDVDDRTLVRSALYYDIVKRFSEAQIVIPFPQRDLHLITGDESAVTSALQKPSGHKN